VTPLAADERGIATIWTIAVAGACLLMTGLVLDGGTVLRARSSAFDLAGGAARAAAQQLDQPALAQGLVIIDAEAARTAALDWLAARDATGSVVVTSDTVTVTIHREVRLQMLRPWTVTVDETASAQAQRGRQTL
jgi:hypothetical protein